MIKSLQINLMGVINLKYDVDKQIITITHFSLLPKVNIIEILKVNIVADYVK